MAQVQDKNISSHGRAVSIEAIGIKALSGTKMMGILYLHPLASNIMQGTCLCVIVEGKEYQNKEKSKWCFSHLWKWHTKFLSHP